MSMIMEQWHGDEEEEVGGHRPVAPGHRREAPGHHPVALRHHQVAPGLRQVAPGHHSEALGGPISEGVTWSDEECTTRPRSRS